MNDRKEKSPLLETTEDARLAAKTLLRTARHAALGTIEPESGYPLVTRTNVATTMEGNPIFLLSNLAAHTKAIKADARTSLLIGEPGKGDPLAHPRITLLGKTKTVPAETEAQRAQEAHLRARYLARHPKAELYNQLPDFFIYELVIERALLNAGFGKAYELTGKELTLEKDVTDELKPAEASIIEHMNEDHKEAVNAYALALCGAQPGAWRLTGIDPEGADLMAGENAARLAFAPDCRSAGDVRERLLSLAKVAREAKT